MSAITSNSPGGGLYKYRIHIFVVLVLCLCYFFSMDHQLSSIVGTSSSSVSTTTYVSSPTGTSARVGLQAPSEKTSSSPSCRKQNIRISIDRNEVGGNDLLDYDSIWKSVATHRQKMEDQIKPDYGVDTFEQIFYEGNISRGRLAMGTSDHSWQGLVERLQIKLLTVQQEILTREKQGRCESESESAGGRTFYARWVYASAGHSSSAGHGNFHKDSYSAVLERAAQPVFAAIGIDLETRNYGMSGQSSSPELVFCMESVYGTDVDLLSYDFGQTEGRTVITALPFWMRRAGLHQNRPALMTLHNSNAMYDIMLDLDRQKLLTTLTMNGTVMGQIGKAIPDTFGLSKEEIAQMPPYIRQLKCQGVLENGEPGCNEKKWDMSICPDRKWRTNWHPGYKRLALTGNMLALFLVDALQDSIRGLQESMDKVVTLDNIEEKLVVLKDRQTKQYAALESSNASWPMLQDIPTELQDVGQDWFLRSRSLCRIAKLPAQQRYQGILTGRTDYDWLAREGVERTMIPRRTDHKEDQPLELAHANNTRQWCNISTNNDYPDFFYVTQNWRRTTIPSQAETDAYGKRDFHGLIILCPVQCKILSFGKCEGDEVTNFTMVDLQVNGITAQLDKLYARSHCFLLHHKEGYIFPANQERKYDLRFRVNPEMGAKLLRTLLQISSIILI
jgi:hypothetical protein